jgi:hypothetical protein
MTTLQYVLWLVITVASVEVGIWVRTNSRSHKRIIEDAISAAVRHGIAQGAADAWHEIGAEFPDVPRKILQHEERLGELEGWRKQTEILLAPLAAQRVLPKEDPAP